MVKKNIKYNDLLTFWGLDKQHSRIVQGDKIKWIYLKDNPYKIEALAFLDFDMPHKIKELLDKYNIKKFKENENKLRTFKLVDFADCKTIMTHCIIDTKKDAEIEGYKTKKELYCKLTDKEYIEVCEKFNHYYPEFYKQREAFIKAFIIKNDLGIIDSGQNNEVEDLSMINSMLKSVSQNKFTKNPYLIAC
jgi:hypothetical protein